MSILSIWIPESIISTTLLLSKMLCFPVTLSFSYLANQIMSISYLKPLLLFIYSPRPHFLVMNEEPLMSSFFTSPISFSVISPKHSSPLSSTCWFPDHTSPIVFLHSMLLIWKSFSHVYLYSPISATELIFLLKSIHHASIPVCIHPSMHSTYIR